MAATLTTPNTLLGALQPKSEAAKLATEYDAPADAILADIVPVIQDLADKGYVLA